MVSVNIAASILSVSTLLLLALLPAAHIADAFQFQQSATHHHCHDVVFSATSLHAVPSHAVAVADAEAVTEKAIAITFVTPPNHVYIEDTDAYGVMYNTNYLRAYERALHRMSMSITRPTPPSHINVKGLNGGVSALDHAGWFVLGVTEHRFKGSPPLGGAFVVSGELMERDCCEKGTGACVERWKLEMMKSSSGSDEDEAKQPQPTVPVVYNKATITIASPSQHSGMSMLPPQYHPKADPLFDDHTSGVSGGSTSTTVIRSTYEPYRDEFDPELPHRMPLRNVLNLFERARTDYLGGPDVLRKMQAEDNIVWVVTGIDQCELCNLGEAGCDDDTDREDDLDLDLNNGKEVTEASTLVQCTPGRSVTVKTNFVSKRGGMIVICNHMLLVSTLDAKLGTYRNRRLAQGVVSIMALDAKKRRPTRNNIPQWFMDKINNN
jgi:hypothetical protein